MVNGCPYKIYEQRVRVGHGAFEFGMELDTNEPGVAFEFQYFHQVAFLVDANRHVPVLFELLTEPVVEFKAVAVPLYEGMFFIEF